MQDSIFNSLVDAIMHYFSNAYGVMTGLFASLIGYFLPVKDIVNVLLIFFFLDVIFGYWAARKLRKERFSVKIIWGHTLPRMLISIVIITGAFMWDKTYSQDLVSTYKLIGWFISGVLLYSIAQNGYKITKWSALPDMAGIIGEKVRDRTGHDVPKETTDNQN